MSISTDSSPSNMVLVQKGEKFFICEPELGVIASGDNVEAAYERFIEARRGFIAQVEQAGLQLDRSPPAVQVAALPASRRGVVGELGLFLAKIVIVVILVGAIGMVVASGVTQSIDRVAAGVGPIFAGLGKLSLADVAVKAQDIARDARDLPADRKELLRQSVGTLSREIEPVVEAWRNPPQPPAKP